jgi:hypothetical protein
MIHGNVEKALDLPGMKVGGDDPVGPGAGEQVGHEFGGDGILGLVFLSCRAYRSRADYVDPIGRCPLQGVDHDQKLHQVLVHGVAGGLHDEDVRPPDALLYGKTDLSVGKAEVLRPGELDPQFTADSARKGRMSRSGKDLQLPRVGPHHFWCPPPFAVFLFSQPILRYSAAVPGRPRGPSGTSWVTTEPAAVVVVPQGHRRHEHGVAAHEAPVADHRGFLFTPS